MFKKYKGKLFAIAPAASLAALSAPAFASGSGGVDVTGVVTAINDTLAPIGAIGAAVLLVIVGIKTYKWVRRAM